jgi:hypothetical protein
MCTSGIYARRAGQTLAELLVGMVWLAVLLGLYLAWGWVTAVVGLAASVALLYTGSLISRYHLDGSFQVQSAPCARCGKVGEYAMVQLRPRRECRCACGTAYVFSGPTLCIVQDGAPPRPYLRWKWWGKGRWRSVGPAARPGNRV